MQIELINQVAGPPLSALGSNLTLKLKVTDSLTREWTKVRISQKFQNEKLRYKVLLDDVEELNVDSEIPQGGNSSPLYLGLIFKRKKEGRNLQQEMPW